MRAKGSVFIVSLCLCVFGLARPGMGVTHVWAFDEGGGNRAVDMAGDRSGTVYGAKWVPGRVGAALQFDGLDDYVALPDNEPVWLPANDFAVCFWVYFERDKGSSSYYDNEVLVDLNHGSSSDPFNELGYVVLRRGDTAQLGFQMTTMEDPDEDVYAETIPVKDRWYHVAAVRRGTSQELYIDGELEASRACSSTPITFVGGYDDDRVNVGRYTNLADGPRYYFKGMMDELMLFDRALSPAEIQRLYRDGGVPGNWYVDGTQGSERNDGLSPRSAFATIQKAIAAARDGDVVNIYPGVYREAIRFLGKAVAVRSAADAAILEAPEQTAVSFDSGEGPNSVLRNVIVRNSRVGISCTRSSPTITNVTVTGNLYGAEAYGSYGGLWNPRPSITNSILWANTQSGASGFHVSYSCVQPVTFGPSSFRYFGILNFSEDPLFVDAERGDYHVRSARGRYWPEHDVWVLDDVTSPCIDAGDPAADFSAERTPNGGRLNVGAHGGTPYAERSEPAGPALPGDINGDGLFDNSDYELFMVLWEQRRQSEPPGPPRRR